MSVAGSNLNCTLIVPNPCNTLFCGSDDANQKIKYNSSRNEFIIDLRQLSSEDLQSGRLSVNVVSSIPPFGKGQQATWKTIQVSFDCRIAASLKRILPGTLRQKRDELIEKITPKKDIYLTLTHKYQELFVKYSNIYVEHQIHLATKVFPQAQDIAHFSEFEKLDDPPKDASLIIVRSQEESKGEIDPEDQIPIHKFVLIKTSSKLAELAKHQNRFAVNCSSVETAKKLMLYLYTKKLQVTTGVESLELFRFAKKFQIEHLKQSCYKQACQQSLALSDPKYLKDPAAFSASIQNLEPSEMVKTYETAAAKVQTFITDHLGEIN